MRRIEVTPEEAKKKLCPVVQPFVQSANTDRPSLSRCISTECMHWAWSSVPKGTVEVPEKGYCSS